MTTLIDTQKFDTYLDQVQTLAIRIGKEENALTELLNLIENQQIEWCEIPSYEEFFNGELAFFKQDYDQALKHYLQARQIPYFQFFCYRASAFVSKNIGNIEKAISFGRKALKFFPEDYLLLNLLKELLDSDAHKESVNEIDQKLNSLEGDETEPYEFNQIFETPEESTPDLFAEEHLQTSPKSFTEVPAAYDFSSILTEPQVEKEATATPNLVVKSESCASGECSQKSRLKEYANQKNTLLNQCLVMLAGKTQEDQHFLLTERSRKGSVGFYLRWNNKGIVINPGSNFLRHFHEQGLHVSDIDYVIVTQEDPEAYADIREIHDLAFQVNQLGTESKLIHYYLNQKAYQELSQVLKPTSKQAKNSLHALDFFMDSPDLEKVELNSEITLNYFSAASNKRNHLGIRLDLRDSSGKNVRCGYVSGTSWTPALAQHLKHADILLAGFGSILQRDFEMAEDGENLGYRGTLNLLQEAAPRLFLCTEFGGQQGDLRMEIIKKLRAAGQSSSVVLPADAGLKIDMENHLVQCSYTQQWIAPTEVRAFKTPETFGRFSYLSNDYYL